MKNLNESILNACYVAINESGNDSFKFGKRAEVDFDRLLSHFFQNNNDLILKFSDKDSFIAKSYEYNGNAANKIDFIFYSDKNKTGDKVNYLEFED